MSPAATFEEQRQVGRTAELAVAEWLRQDRGHYVLPSYDYSGAGDNKAPKLEGPRARIVVPDLVTWRDRCYAFEVKLKSRADLYRKTGTLETGISERLWNHYHEFQRVTGAETWILFVHRAEREVRGAPLDELERLISHRGSMNGRPHVFFRYLGIRLLGPIDMLRWQP